MSERLTIFPLRQERLRRGWSLVALCVRTGIAPSDLSAVERGLRPAHPGWRRRIAAALEMSAEELFPPEKPAV